VLPAAGFGFGTRHAPLAAQTARRLVACRRPFALFSAPLNAPCAATPAAAPQQQPNPEHLFLTCHTQRRAPPPTAVSTYRLPRRKTIAQQEHKAPRAYHTHPAGRFTSPSATSLSITAVPDNVCRQRW
jgi:hypothetical protein